MKKYLLIIPLFFLAAPSAIAYDFGAAGYIAAIGATAIGVAAVVGAAPALATLAIGAGVMGITFDKTEATGSPLVVQVSPSAKMATPEGWTAPAAGQSQPTPPASAAQAFKANGCDGTGASVDAVAQACVAINIANQNYPAGSAFAYCEPNYGVPGWACYATRPGMSNAGFNVYAQCPTGYTANGSSCDLTTPTDVQKPSDGACGITRVGNSFSADAQDPDCSTLPATTSIQPNTITQTKPDGSQKSVTINGDGSVTATDSRPDAATNTTQVNTTQLGAPDATGVAKVSGQGSGATNGTGSANSGAPVPTFDKTGLATETTLGGIKSDTGVIKDALTNSGNVDGSLTAEKSALDAAVDSVSALFTAEPSKSSGIDNDFSISGVLPAQCGCTPLTMTFHGKTASFDWCTPMATMKNALAWVIGLFTAFYLIFLFRVGGGK